MSEVFTMHEFRINVKRNQKFNLRVFGDQHCESKSHDADRYDEDLQEAKTDKSAYFFFMGDEHDLASFTERKAIRHAPLHESTLHDLDQLALMKCRRFVAKHEWMKGRIIGMIQGNHYWTFSSDSVEDGIVCGMSSTQWIAKQLECAWLGWLSYVRVHLHDGGISSSFDIVASHGKAGGRLIGTAYNQVSELKAIFPSADIYMMGHDHKRGLLPDSSLHIPVKRHDGGLMLKQRRQWMVRTGSYLKGYVPNTDAYIVGRLLKPYELGCIRLEVTMKRDRTGGVDLMSVDIHGWA